MPGETSIGTLRVLSPGVCTLLVDHGRPRWRSLGVPVGGAADRASLALGNALVGNPPDAPALEVCLSGPTLEADVDLGCVLFGAPFDLSTDQRPLVAGKTFTLAAGEPLSIGGTPAGKSAYLCVRGGLSGPVILGSQSSLQPLTAGAELGCTPGRIGARSVRAVPSLHGTQPLRVLPGPQADWFPAEVLRGRSFVVSPASNRMGLRLKGEPLPMTGREMVSEPVCPGTVQVTRDGQCIVLGVDGQTIGGYPKVAQVIGADLDRVGQLRPGDRIAFAVIDLDEAERLYRRGRQELGEWVVRLTTASGGW